MNNPDWFIKGGMVTPITPIEVEYSEDFVETGKHSKLGV
jgi:hypothetical protein